MLCHGMELEQETSTENYTVVVACNTAAVLVAKWNSSRVILQTLIMPSYFDSVETRLQMSIYWCPWAAAGK